MRIRVERLYPPVTRGTRRRIRKTRGSHAIGGVVKSYVVEFLVLEPCSSPIALRQWLTKALPWTRELAVGGDESVLRVHVRTSRPDLAIAADVECGRLRDILVEPEAATHARY